MRPSLAQALAEHPVLANQVYLFPPGPETPFAPPPRGLLVVRVPDAMWSAPADARLIGEGAVIVRGDGWPTAAEYAEATRDDLWPVSDAAPTQLEILLGDAAVCHRYPWIRDVAPPSQILRWLRAASREHRVPVAWYHLMERGDDLYYDLAVVFDGAREEALLHSTLLASGADAGRVHVAEGVIDLEPSFEWVLTEVWRALGAETGPAYFYPDDAARFDWDRLRVENDAESSK